MYDQQQSPIETPTTPSTPTLPPFSQHTNTARRRSSAASSETVRSRRSSVISIPTSPLQTVITMNLPVRPSRKSSATITSASRPTSPISKPSSRRTPPLKYHVRVVPTSPSRSAGFQQVVNHLRTPLIPLISVSTGRPHPQFPTSLLRFHLLTHEELDNLTRFYHQVAPAVRETNRYPGKIKAWVGEEAVQVDLETKRRRWGRFVGLRGCESPVVERTDTSGEVETQPETREEMEGRVEREWRRAVKRERDEEIVREKGWRGRW